MTLYGSEAALEVKVNSTEWMNTSAAAKRLGVHPKTIIRWVQLGYFVGAFRLNPFAEKSPYLIPVSSIEEFEKKRGQGLIPSEN